MIVPFLYFSVFHLLIWGFNKDFSHSTVSSFLSLKLVKLAGSGPVQWKSYNFCAFFCKGPDSCVRNSRQGVLGMICVMNTRSCWTVDRRLWLSNNGVVFCSETARNSVSSCSRNGATEWWRGPPDLSVKKTFILPTGQPTTLTPCENKFGVWESNPASLNTMNKAVDIPEYDIFTKTKGEVHYNFRCRNFCPIVRDVFTFYQNRQF
jgi:hypothetical protein